MGFYKAKKGSDAENFGWNDLYKKYKNNEDIKERWKELFSIENNNNCNKYDFFELAKMFISDLTKESFEERWQYADELDWGFTDKLAKNAKDKSKAEKAFVTRILLGFY